MNTLGELKQLYRLRQLQGVIPMDWTFEQYVDFIRDLYRISN